MKSGIFQKKKNQYEYTKNKTFYLLISIISLICVIFSLIIYLQKVADNENINNFCSALGSQSQCETVQSSVYGKILGVDNPVFGLIGFTALMILSFMYYRTGDSIAKHLTSIGIIIAAVGALWFLYLQAFVIGAYCIFCVIVDVLSIIMLFSLAYVILRRKIEKIK